MKIKIKIDYFEIENILNRIKSQMNRNFEKFLNNYDKYHKMVKIKIRRSKSKQIKTTSN